MLSKLLVALTGFATLNTLLLVLDIVAPSFFKTPLVAMSMPGGGSPSSSSEFLMLTWYGAGFLAHNSISLTPASWLVVGGLWLWRGHIRTTWEGLGFDSEVFRLFLRMKGGKTKLRLLNALSEPKDRYQLARELDLDWKTVDQHIAVMRKYGLLSEDVAYGKVRLYHVTASGRLILQLLDDLAKSTDSRRLVDSSSEKLRTIET